ncbi:hypothetical protein [Thetidibacter halocola]|uniref:Uncharacterized protein n=1 Tax=Thetidibacter halocola TaxID=2827239 RepID=A0A8J7WF24_9RHOB|nr:hypothetical protein [Thetidibacter halocola]MBS0126460.1 hypothetical protein [Thetidibacter halocola]
MELLESPQASDETIVSASAAAAEKSLAEAARDPVYVEAVRLLLVIPYCARSHDFPAALRDNGVAVRQSPELIELLAAATSRLDEIARQTRNRTDIGELAAHALTGTLSLLVGENLPGLFDATPEDVQSVVRKLSWSNGISQLARLFYARLVSDCLSYWLDRTLAEQIGPDRRFANLTDRTAFDAAVFHYSQEATRIIQEFSGGWYGKTIHVNGGINSHDANIFGSVALKKIVAELRERRERDA